MFKVVLFFVFAVSAFGDFNNQTYADVCYTYAHNRRDLQPPGDKAAEIRSNIVNTAYVTSKVVRWEREKEFEFPILALIEDEVIEQACMDTLTLQKTSKKENFVFYLAYQKAVYLNTVEALMKLAKPRKNP
ncbi:MAG TPA: hypothetical protein VFX57_06015 [Sulfuricurvum sp.]|nr:hypothetical protein [Sulfuricurvum sp.]